MGTSKNLSRRQRTRKRQTLETLQIGLSKKDVAELEGEVKADPAGPLSLPSSRSHPSRTPCGPAEFEHSTNPISMITSAFPESQLIEHHQSAPMATQRHASGPRITSGLAPAIARRTSVYDLEGDQEPASSQPVSLMQLYRKSGSSRNKTFRGSKAFQSDDADDMVDVAGDATFSDVDKYESPSRLSLWRPSDGRDYELRDDSGHLTATPRIYSQEYLWKRCGEKSEGAREQAWRVSADEYHTQKNPLNYSSHYNLSHSRETSCISESPFLVKTDRPFSEFETGPADMTPVSRWTPISMPRSHSGAQKVPFQKEYISASSLQIYRASFDRPHDKSPYESFRLKHRLNRTDIPEITSGLQYPSPLETQYGQCTGNTTIRSEPTLATRLRERLPNFETSTYSRYLAASHEPEDVSAIGSDNFTITASDSSPEAIKRTLKEEIYAILDNMSLVDPESGSKRTVSPKDVTEKQTPSTVYDRLQPSNSSDHIALPSVAGSGCCDMKSKRKDCASPIDRMESRNEISRQQYEIAKENPSLESGLPDYEPIIQTEGYLTSLPKLSGASAGRVMMPPPGLTRPAYKTDLSASCTATNLSHVQARLDEADAWFHTDGRGEEQLRQHVASIAENYAERSESVFGKAFSTPDSITTKQTILLLGNVIANLYSYVSGNAKDQNTYFAKFGPVGPSYCEMPSTGQRRHFDHRPTVVSWGLPVDKTASNDSNNPE